MNTKALRAQVLSIRAQCDAILLQLDEEQPPGPQKAPEAIPPENECPHPESWRTPVQTMGRTGWYCRCGYVDEGAVDGGELKSHT